MWVFGHAAIAGTLPLAIKGKVHDQYGQQGVARLERWEKLVWDITYHNVADQLREVNDFFNQLQFSTDLNHWQQEDYWATPIETLASNGGDCEDFAIAKYFTLRQLGVSANQMRITYVKALRLNEPHMVLTYYPDDGEPLVLDILIPEMLPASKRTDLQPVYSFNAEGLWKAKTRGEDTRLGNADDITMWRDLRVRLGMGRL
jgi:predicted transglutaminase-like cysteine proteinase